MGFGPNKEFPNGEGMWTINEIFYSTSNFRGRIEMLDRMMVRFVRDDALMSEWNAVKNKSTRLYARRNVLAHGMVWAGNDPGTEIMGYPLHSPQKQQLNFEQILQAKVSFCRYEKRVSELAIAVNQHLANR